jgi:REP element-mobilizing transposase RayT
MIENTQKRKKIHLKSFEYTGRCRYFVTICVAGKRSLFLNKLVVAPLLDLLKQTSKFYGFTVWAYCFMPDHVHILVEGLSDRSDLKKFISMFKQKSSFWYKREFGSQLWQANYYEHVLRGDEGTTEIAYYIFTNPVRKRLVEDYRDHPFSGSFQFDLKDNLF